MSNLLSFEIKQHEAYRFIGKSVYARAGMQCGDAYFNDFLFENTNWMREKLDEMQEYTSDIIQNAALMTWEKYCDKTKLLGFTYGRFMKPETPVPDGMDYFDIAEGYMAIGLFDNWDNGNQEGDVKKAIDEQGGYKNASWRFMGELNHGDGNFGYFISCDKATTDDANMTAGTSP